MNSLTQFLSQAMGSNRPYRDLAAAIVIGVSMAYGIVHYLSR